MFFEGEKANFDVGLNCTTLQTNQSMKLGNFRDVNRNGVKNPASEVETNVALEVRPSALKAVHLLWLTRPRL